VNAVPGLNATPRSEGLEVVRVQAWVGRSLANANSRLTSLLSGALRGSAIPGLPETR
jgi:hypothetical protein